MRDKERSISNALILLMWSGILVFLIILLLKWSFEQDEEEFLQSPENLYRQRELIISDDRYLTEDLTNK